MLIDAIPKQASQYSDTIKTRSVTDKRNYAILKSVFLFFINVCLCVQW